MKTRTILIVGTLALAAIVGGYVLLKPKKNNKSKTGDKGTGAPAAPAAAAPAAAAPAAKKKGGLLANIDFTDLAQEGEKLLASQLSKAAAKKAAKKAEDKAAEASADGFGIAAPFDMDI